jgi:hypothetical protein
MVLLILLLLLFFLLPRTAHAKGGGSTTQVDTVGPKNERLIGLENQFYDLADMTMGAYTQPLSSNSVASAGKGGSVTPNTNNSGSGNNAFQQASLYATNNNGRLIDNKDGTYSVRVENSGGNSQGGGGSKTINFGTQSTSASPSSNNIVSADKGGTTGYSGGVPQPYDNNTMMGQLFNDATKKTYAANQRYDDLFAQSPQLSQQSQSALAQMNSLLGQGADAVNQSKTAGDKYFSQADDMFANSARYLQTGEGYLSKAGTEGDWWYDQAKNAYAQAQGFLPQIQDQFNYTTESNKWYDDYTRDALTGSKNLLDTGEIPKPLMDAMLASMTSGVNQSVGANINNLASRGVINSSVTNRGLADASRAVSDSMNANYLNAFNTILGGYNDTAATGANAGKAFADSNMNIISGMNDTMANAIGLGDSYGKTGSMRVNDLLGVAQGYGNYSSIANQNAGTLMDAGSQRINDWLNIAQGYNQTAGGYGDLSNGYLSNLEMNLKEREGLQNDLSKYFTNAAAPMMPAYNLMQTMQQDHWNSDKKDTIVQQGSGCFITTAVCDSLEKPDDCYELTTLRHYRDMWLKFQPGGEELVKEYYEVAPRMVERINTLPDKDTIYSGLWKDYIQPCVKHIETHEYEPCKERYIEMVNYLKELVGTEESEAA